MIGDNATDQQILDAARDLMQVRGFSAFRYADFAAPEGAVIVAAQPLRVGIEGAMLAPRAHDDDNRFDVLAARLPAAIYAPA